MLQALSSWMPKSVVALLAVLVLAAALAIALFSFSPVYLGFAILLLPFLQPVFLANALAVSLTIESILVPRHRLWMIVPIAWFGGHMLLLGASWYQHYDLSRELAAFNSGKTISMSLDEVDIVMETRGASELVLSYGAKVAFDGYSRHLAPQLRSSRIGNQAACRKIKRLPGWRSSSARGLNGENSIRGSRFNNPHSLCHVTKYEKPTKPAVYVDATEQKLSGWLLPVTLRIITILQPDGKILKLRGGYARPIPWIPGAALFACLHRRQNCIRRDAGRLSGRSVGLTFPPLTSDSTVHVIATALGLRARRPSLDQVSVTLDS